MSSIEHDKFLLEGLAAQDKTAVEQWYRDHFTMVKALVVNNNGSADDAADIFQEVMIVLYQKVKQGNFELHCQLKTFIYSVSRRLWLKKLQQLQRFASDNYDVEETVHVEDDVEYHLKKQEEFTIMEAAMAKIGEPCKSLLQAYYIEKKHMNEIASVFGYTNADNAKTQKYKCLVRLKKLFFAQYKND